MSTPLGGTSPPCAGPLWVVAWSRTEEGEVLGGLGGGGPKMTPGPLNPPVGLILRIGRVRSGDSTNAYLVDRQDVACFAQVSLCMGHLD